MKLIVDIHKKIGNFSLDSSFETDDMIIGFLGASGCGKSMTLKCIAGIITPDYGYIEYDGRVLFDSSRRINIKPQERHVGYLFQNYALFPTMTVKKNIMCGLTKERNKVEKREKYLKILSLLHLEEIETHFPHQISGGQAQRTALARMLASSPDLLLLDEPFSALDMFLRKSLQSELSALLVKVGRQAIIVTHSSKEIRKMCSSIYVMDEGRIIQGGRTDFVLQNPMDKRCSVLFEE